jgi:antitoxin HigA-1
MSIRRKGKPTWKVHPGEILREEFLKPMKCTPYALAKGIHVPAPRINDIVLEKRGITADTAVRWAKFFGTTEQFWLGLQSGLRGQPPQAKHQEQLEQIQPLKAYAAARY